MIDPDALKPLLPSAREEIARQIGGVANAERLVAVGFSWNLAFAIARQITEGSGNIGVLWREGLGPQVATAIANAINAAHSTAPASPRPERSERGLHMQGAQRGAMRQSPAFSEKWW